MQIEEVIDFIKTCTKKDLYTIRRESQARITNMNQENKVMRIPEQWALEIAHELSEAAKHNFPFIKPFSLSDWADEIEKLHRLDGQEIELIRGIALWSQTDDFWKKQIRSGGSLRRHFEKLYIAGKSAYEKKQKGRTHVI